MLTSRNKQIPKIFTKFTISQNLTLTNTRQHQYNMINTNLNDNYKLRKK